MIQSINIEKSPKCFKKFNSKTDWKVFIVKIRGVMYQIIVFYLGRTKFLKFCYIQIVEMLSTNHFFLDKLWYTFSLVVFPFLWKIVTTVFDVYMCTTRCSVVCYFLGYLDIGKSFFYLTLNSLCCKHNQIYCFQHNEVMKIEIVIDFFFRCYCCCGAVNILLAKIDFVFECHGDAHFRNHRFQISSM